MDYIYGKLNQSVLPFTYQGINSATVDVIVDNTKRTIQVDVKSLDNYATINSVTEKLAYYVKVETGKGLSTNDYTTLEKNKLRDIEDKAQVNVQSDFNETDTASDAYIKNKPQVGVDDPTKTEGQFIAKIEVDPTNKYQINVTKGQVSFNNLTDIPQSFPAAPHNHDEVYVKLETGKGLSTNDYSTEEKNKLTDIAANADVNIINSITRKGVALPVDGNKAVEIDDPDDQKKLEFTNSPETVPTDNNDIVVLYEEIYEVPAGGGEPVLVQSVLKQIKTKLNDIVQVLELPKGFSGNYQDLAGLPDISGFITQESVNTHDADPAAHNGIIGEVAEVRNIAEGRITALSFPTAADLLGWLAEPSTYIRQDGKTKADLTVGMNLYIQEAGPDYWWNGTGLSVLLTDLPQNATAEVDGLMSKSDKAKLDNVAPGAEVNVINKIKVNDVEQAVTDETINITIPIVSVNDNVATEGQYISKIEVDATDKHKLNITKAALPAIPDISLNDNTATDGQYISKVEVDPVDKHKLNIIKAALPTNYYNKTEIDSMLSNLLGGSY